jgi:putative ATPase
MMSLEKEKEGAEEYYRARAPLAERMRPAALDEFLGQESLMGEGSAFREALEADKITSLILWGPPGTGKTTLGHLVASVTGRAFIHLSAVSAGVKAIKEAVQAARELIRLEKRGTLLFIDEIHRFNKAQQDALLPHVEKGTVTLIGATTENPSFEVNNALLSRCQVSVLEPLDPAALGKILGRALSDTRRGIGEHALELDKEAETFIISMAMGDARIALNHLELAAHRCLSKGEKCISVVHVEDAAGAKSLHYDKDGEEHFNLISALHKSLRGSDPQAAVYYLVRMLKGGEDPLYIARRMVRFASEDIGCADPRALSITLAAMEAVRFLGLPECDTALAEAAVYLATAPKSNAVYMALKKASKAVDETGHLPVPKKIRNAPTGLMKNLGYGRGYRYPHDYEDGFVPEEYLPDGIRGRTFYEPSSFGFEREIRKRIEYWNGLRGKKTTQHEREDG